MCGIELPVLAMEHMYLVTEPVPELASTGQARAAALIDFAGEVYMRKEGGGLLLGTYERHGVPWSPQRPRGTSGTSCCRPTSTASPPAGVAFDHFPAFAEAGIKP